MVIKAKFPGRCNICGGRIETGDNINWEKGSGASHTGCTGAPRSSEPPPPNPDWKPPALVLLSGAPGREELDRMVAEHGCVWAGERTYEFDHLDRGGIREGDILKRSQEPLGTFMVTAVYVPYYHTAEDCRNMRCFCGKRGWRTHYLAREVTR